MKRLAIIAALISHAAFAATLTDNFGRTVAVSGNIYSVPGITLTAPNDAAALTVLNGMAPDSWKPPAPAPVTTISALAFIGRFTPAEQSALMSANPMWGLQIAATGTVDVTDPRVIAGLDAAVKAGVLTQARATQVLNLAVASP